MLNDIEGSMQEGTLMTISTDILEIQLTELQRWFVVVSCGDIRLRGGLSGPRSLGNGLGAESMRTMTFSTLHPLQTTSKPNRLDNCPRQHDSGPTSSLRCGLCTPEHNRRRPTKGTSNRGERPISKARGRHHHTWMSIHAEARILGLQKLFSTPESGEVGR